MNVFVYFTPDGKRRPCWYDRPVMLDMLQKSARRYGYKCYLLTDDETDYPGWESIGVRGGGIMYERCVAYAEGLTMTTDPTLCVDMDVLVNRDIMPLFEADLNIPIRGKRAAAGVVYVKTPEAGVDLFTDMANRYAAMTPDQQRTKTIDGALEAIVRECDAWEGGNYNQWSIGALDFADANFAPEPEWGPDSQLAKTALLWHFKGLRKDFMPRFYNSLPL